MHAPVATLFVTGDPPFLLPRNRTAMKRFAVKLTATTAIGLFVVAYGSAARLGRSRRRPQMHDWQSCMGGGNRFLEVLFRASMPTPRSR